MSAFIAELDVCPDCGGEWAYESLSGKRCSWLIGIYSTERDRTVAWRCPHCGHQWERGATVEPSAPEHSNTQEAQQ